MIDLEPEYAGPYPSGQSDVNYFTLNVGGGMIVGSPTGRLALTTEFRAHRSLATTHGTRGRSLLSLSVGGRIAW